MSGIHDLASRLLHTVDPEEAHGLTIKGLKYGLGPRPVEADDPILATSLAGLALPNCIGLAAGFDPDLATAYGDIIGSETATLGQHVLEGRAKLRQVASVREEGRDRRKHVASFEGGAAG